MLVLVAGCQNDPDEDEIVDEEEEGEVIFEFPDILYVDSLVYLEIKKVCENQWDLSVMEESTFVVVSYLDKYVAHCVGVDGNRYMWFILTFDTDGNLIGESKKDYLGLGTFFDYKNIEELKLDSIRDFWNGSLTIDTVASGFNKFRNFSGFIGDISKTDEKGNTIVYSVFNTKNDAVKAIEARMSSDSCAIIAGNSQALPGFWWTTECGLYNAVIVNRWNTIFEVGRNNVYFEAVDDTLFQTGNEIVRRTRLLLN
jgi:hypothetical protein